MMSSFFFVYCIHDPIRKTHDWEYCSGQILCNQIEVDVMKFFPTKNGDILSSIDP